GLVRENMESYVVEYGICGMTMSFPASIGEIELDCAAKRFAAIDSDSGVGKIMPFFAVPGAELDDLDLVFGDGSEMPAEIAGEPARLQFELRRRAKGGKERAFLDTGGIAKLGVAAG